MAINLHSKYATQLQKYCTTKSLLAGRLSKEYDFAGNESIKVTTLVTVPMNNYQRSGTERYGTPQEMQDIIQELKMTQDKSFSLVIDKGNNQDQDGIKSAGNAMRQQLDEQQIPLQDKYGFAKLVEMAGNVVANGTALSKTNICDRISEGTLKLDDGEIPQDGRTLFVPNTTYKLLKHSDEFLGIDELGKDAVAKGIVGSYDNMDVVKVPSGRWPANVNFLIVYKKAATLPVKLNETQLHKSPRGISGNVLEGRFRYDCFVFGAKCAGVYAEINTASGGGTVVATPTLTAATGVLACATSGATIKFTTDGTDPRYSATAKVGTSAGTVSGTVVKAYAFKDEAYPSAVLEGKITG